MFLNLENELRVNRITKKSLAQMIGISEKSINNKMGGKNEFTFREIKKIAEIFPGKSIEYLFDIRKKTA